MLTFKSFFKNIVSRTGYNIYKRNLILNNPLCMSAGLERIKLLNINPESVIDVGAAEGKWTEMAISFWPDARYELIEPLLEQSQKLEGVKSKFSNIDYHLAVAGEKKGEVWLNVSADLDGSGIYGIENKNKRKVPVITIDELTKDRIGSIMIKLDTHGYEVPILKGAVETLKRTSLIVVEVYGFYVSPTGLLFHELSAFLFELGFRLIDVVDVMRRPRDQAFWQADAFYIRKEHPVFERNSYA